MKNDKFLEALSGIVPAEAQKEVNEAISSFLESAKSELQGEFDAKLNEEKDKFIKELKESEKVAEEGYAEAWSIISDLKSRLELQKEEFEQALEEGFEEAYQMLQEEKSKNDTLEADLYEEYDKRFEEVKEFYVNKLDEFLQLEGKKYYETAKRDVLNDPAIIEHKLAFNKILDIACEYLSDEDYAFATSNKVEELAKSLEESKAQMKVLESKNMRLSMENTKLNEAVRQKQEVINESIVNEKKERLEKAKKVEARGKVKTEDLVVLGENKETVAEPKSSVNPEVVQEQRLLEDWKQLAGLTK